MEMFNCSYWVGVYINGIRTYFRSLFGLNYYKPLSCGNVFCHKRGTLISFYFMFQTLYCFPNDTSQFLICRHVLINGRC